MRCLFRGRISPKCATRPGSALLVVLGMLAFMVISGVAFSVFMRSARLTSSFTRRTSSSRQLAKAALAEAIDQIDRSIGNDPHPNVRCSSGDKYNHWLGRVFLAPYEYVDDRGNTTTKWASDVKNDIINRIGKESSTSLELPSTVPVLTLEALAYIPPPLVNEARYYGQVTPTAAWQTFDFDAGRYAYIALDVSDYFDVNRLVADEPRSSNPSRRVTFSHLFEGGTEDDPHSSAPSGADGWDSFMDTYRDVKTDGSFDYGSKIPFVSLADFNLAFDEKFTDSGLNGMKSPFCRYIKENSNNGFYGPTAQSDLDKFAEMTFVTDSLEAPIAKSEATTASGKAVLNLDGASNPYDDDSNQPFPIDFLESSQNARTLQKVAMTGNSRAGYNQFVANGAPYITMFQLSDYLDVDRIPISLGIPSVERVPMICGIKPNFSSPVNVNLVMTPDPDVSTPGTWDGKSSETVTRKIHWRIDPASLNALLGAVDVLVAYPFLNHEQASENGYFTLDGKVQIFLSMKSQPVRLRVGGNPPSDSLHWGDGNPGTAASPGSPVFSSGAILNLPLQDCTIPLSAIDKPEDAVQQLSLTMDLSSCATMIQTALANADILSVSYQWVRNPNANNDPGEANYLNAVPATDIPQTSAGASIVTGTDAPTASWWPVGPNGQLDKSFVSAITTATAGNNIEFFLNFVPTIRIKSSDGKVLGEASGTKTVDMVPASLDDDNVMNSVDNSVGLFYNEFNNGLSTPLMLFKSGFTLNPQTTVSAPVALTFSPAGGIMVDDPRYNHAPENWKELSTFTPAGWYAEAAKSFAQKDGARYARDGDLFMATSDQGYLQSVYELAFLPRLADLKSGAGTTSRGSLGTYWGASCDQLCPTDRNKYPIPDEGVMWKTYDPYGRISTSDDDFEGIGLENLGRGIRVNPYSDATNVLMAAFANTPRDWRTASEQDDTKVNPAYGLDAASFDKKYAWNSYSSGSKLAWEDLEAVAGEFMEEIQGLGNNSWETALYNLFNKERIKTRTGYEDTEDYLCGVKLESPSDKIYSVDKKFLYGYWRNCFSARQQLFLVFFRAEPMMLGGGVAGLMPPQLGARGVALVWRNPNNPQGSAAGTKGYNGTSGDPFDQDPGTDLPNYIPHQTRVLFYKQFE